MSFLIILQYEVYFFPFHPDFKAATGTCFAEITKDLNQYNIRQSKYPKT